MGFTESVFVTGGPATVPGRSRDLWVKWMLTQ